MEKQTQPEIFRQELVERYSTCRHRRRTHVEDHSRAIPWPSHRRTSRSIQNSHDGKKQLLVAHYVGLSKGIRASMWNLPTEQKQHPSQQTASATHCPSIECTTIPDH